MEANQNTLEDMERNISSYGFSFDDIPMVMQFNKRDLPGIIPVEDLQASLNKKGWITVESVALGGQGPAETLKLISEIIARKHIESS